MNDQLSPLTNQHSRDREQRRTMLASATLFVQSPGGVTDNPLECAEPNHDVQAYGLLAQAGVGRAITTQSGQA